MHTGVAVMSVDQSWRTGELVESKPPWPWRRCRLLLSASAPGVCFHHGTIISICALWGSVPLGRCSDLE